MRILIVSTHDSRGGAGKAAYRFAQEYIKQGNEVCLYVMDKKEKDSFIVQSKTPKIISKVRHALDFLPGYILGDFNKNISFTLGLYGESLEPIIKEFKPDIINIQWTWKGFVSFSEICRVSKKIPVIWTMHDYSPFSDGVFYPVKGMNNFVNLLIKYNNSVRKFYLKDTNITFVSPSKYLLDEFNQSYVSNEHKGFVINNGVNQEIFSFKEGNKSKLRKKYNLDVNKRYILFGALNLHDDKVKGGEILEKVLTKMIPTFVRKNIGLLSYGSSNIFDNLPMELPESVERKYFGYVKSDEQMAELVSIADVVLVPSLFENYPFAVVEPLSCGTPVVAFEVGGIPEIIQNDSMGYLAKPFSVKDLEKGVLNILERKDLNYDRTNFNIAKKAGEYIKLFEESR